MNQEALTSAMRSLSPTLSTVPEARPGNVGGGTEKEQNRAHQAHRFRAYDGAARAQQHSTEQWSPVRDEEAAGSNPRGRRQLTPLIKPGMGAIRIEWMHGDVIGASVQVQLDTGGDGVYFTPRHGGIDEAIAPPVGEVLFGEAERMEVVYVVG
jgi:hypothetical protein